jgi:hypothetical protein
MKWGEKAIAAVIVVAALWAPVPALAAPANDDFANRQALTGSLVTGIVATGSNLAAAKEAGESVANFAAGHSVWFEWKAPSTGFVTIGACGSDFDAVLGVFTGATLGSLTRVVSGNASEGPHCPFAEREYTFKTTEDVSYVIGVDGNAMSFPGGPPPATEGPIELRIEATPKPVNDDFANATPLVGSITEEPDRRFYFTHAFGYNWGANKETGEPAHGGDQGGSSVWYSWTAPATGSAQVGVCCGSLSLLDVYLGGAVDSLTKQKLSAFGTLLVVAGTTYRLAVDGKYEIVDGAAKVGGFELTVSMELPPLDPSPPTDPDPPSPTDPTPAGNVTSPPVVPVSPRDSIAPQTTLDSRKVRSRARSASFGFHADEAGSTFRCQLDAGKVTSCRSPKGYSGLAAGQHVFKVYAVDRAGNADPTPATARFATAPAKRKHGRAAAD